MLKLCQVSFSCLTVSVCYFEDKCWQTSKTFLQITCETTVLNKFQLCLFVGSGLLQLLTLDCHSVLLMRRLLHRRSCCTLPILTMDPSPHLCSGAKCQKERTLPDSTTERFHQKQANKINIQADSYHDRKIPGSDNDQLQASVFSEQIARLIFYLIQPCLDTGKGMCDLLIVFTKL